MATQITNQATLTYQYGAVTASAASNIATATLQEALAVTKSALDSGYRGDQPVTYILTATNSSVNALTNVTLTDNLGAYTPTGGTAAVRPLTYTGPAQLYINGVLSGAVTPAVSGGNLVFTIPTLAAGATAMILYKAQANGTALLGAEDSITNTVTAAAAGLTDTSTAEYTLPAQTYADVSILKTMSPSVQHGDLYLHPDQPGQCRGYGCGADGRILPGALQPDGERQRGGPDCRRLHLYRRGADAAGQRFGLCIDGSGRNLCPGCGHRRRYRDPGRYQRGSYGHAVSKAGTGAESVSPLLFCMQPVFWGGNCGTALLSIA